MESSVNLTGKFKYLRLLSKIPTETFQSTLPSPFILILLLFFWSTFTMVWVVTAYNNYLQRGIELDLKGI